MLFMEKDNVFIINNGIIQYKDFLSFDDKRFNVFFVSFEEFFDIQPADLNHVKEHNLLVFKENFLDEKMNDRVKGFFSKSFNFTTPYIVVLTEEEVEDSKKKSILKSENFTFRLPSKDDDCEVYLDNFALFVNLIFDKFVYVERISSYIIDSFQTIINAQIIQEQKKEIEELNRELNKISKIDYLTNVLNRRAFFEALESERKRTMREHWRLSTNCEIKNSDIEKVKEDFENSEVDNKHKAEGSLLDHFGKFCCILFDIDHFKLINDTYGHLSGDEVLRKLGIMLRSKDIFRENDIVARYGGEEFIVILQETNYKHALIPAERLREKIKQVEFESEDGKKFSITISGGISEFSVKDTTNEDIINRADQALYFAKENGRDRIVIYEEQFTDES